MTTAASPAPVAAAINRVVNGLLAIDPLWNVAKRQARRMMIRRAERLGIPWRETVDEFQALDWAEDWQAVHRGELALPHNYRAAFHGYDAGHLCWEAAFEFEVASNAVHSSLFPEAGDRADEALRRGYHEVLRAQLPAHLPTVLDLHCTVGLSTFALHALWPRAALTALDFSPYYLAVARHAARARGVTLDRLVHALPEDTGLPDRAFALVSAFLLFHEMPQDTTRRIFREARRLVEPGGCFAFMDMDPQAHAYATMPAWLMTLLKSTEPYLDQYFALSLEHELRDAGFDAVTITPCSPRHRAVLARVAG